MKKDNETKRFYQILERKNNPEYGCDTYHIMYADEESEPEEGIRCWLPYKGTYSNDGLWGITFYSLEAALRRISMLLDNMEIYKVIYDVPNGVLAILGRDDVKIDN